MSGYRDSLYWASDDEIAAYRERERQASESVSEPAESQPTAKPAYTPQRIVREGERVAVTVRQCTPIKIDGFDI